MQTHGVSPDFRCFPVNKDPRTPGRGRGRYTVNKPVPGSLFGDFKLVLIIQRLTGCGSESVLTHAHCASHLKCYNTLNEIWSPSAAALPKFVSRRLEMIQLPQRNAMLLKFYFLAHLGTGAGSCMTERQINFTVFIAAFFLVSQGLLLLEVTERYAALCRRCIHHTGEGFRVPTIFFFRILKDRTQEV